MNKTTQDVYNAVSNMKRSVLNFAKNMCRGLKQSDVRFVSQMLYGMMSAQDVKLTKIGAALKEKIELKCTEERLRRNLAVFDKMNEIQENYMKKVTKKCAENTLLLIDGGDISKPYGSKFEGLSRVHDGSTGRIEKGFPTIDVKIHRTSGKINWAF